MPGEVIKQINSVIGDTPTTIGEIYTWNQKSGQKASSSGTIYGIYDLSGGVWERTAAYTANGDGRLTNYGKSLLYKESTTEEKNTKYVTTYVHDAQLDNTEIERSDTNSNNLNTASNANYSLEANRKKFGNAMHETSR